jgi:hypothetical protein
MITGSPRTTATRGAPRLELQPALAVAKQLHARPLQLLLLLNYVRRLVGHQAEVGRPGASAEEDVRAEGESACVYEVGRNRGAGVAVHAHRSQVHAERPRDRCRHGARQRLARARRAQERTHRRGRALRGGVCRREPRGPLLDAG